jgi:hypothetical protein
MPINTNFGLVCIKSDNDNLQNTATYLANTVNSMCLLAQGGYLNYGYTVPSNTFCYSSLTISDNVGNTKISGTNPHFLEPLNHNKLYIHISSGTNWTNNFYKIVSVDDTTSITLETPYSASLGSPTISTVSNNFNIFETKVPNMGPEDSLEIIYQFLIRGTANTKRVTINLNANNCSNNGVTYYRWEKSGTGSRDVKEICYIDNTGNTSNQTFNNFNGTSISSILPGYQTLETNNGTTICYNLGFTGAGDWIKLNAHTITLYRSK